MQWVQALNNALWGYGLLYLLLLTGIYFTICLRGVQWVGFPHTCALLKQSVKRRTVATAAPSLSAFQALCTSLAARMGTGNLVGVTVALKAGGPGALFWMWVVAILGMATAFAESVLAQIYKQTDHQQGYIGGPAYYMSYGLQAPWAGKCFAGLLIATFGWMFNAVQANSIAQACSFCFHWEAWKTGVVVALLTGMVIAGGLRRVATFASWMVPIITVAYLLATVWILGNHLQALPSLLALVWRSAWGWREVGAGSLAYTLSQAMLHGVKRGLFSNEAGMGSSPNAAASANPYPPHPVAQGYVQMLGVVVDTFVLCTSTGLIVLVSGVLQSPLVASLDGVGLTQAAFSTEVGWLGAPLIAIASFLFAFSALVSNCAYAEMNLRFLFGSRDGYLPYFRISVLGMICFGAMNALQLVWSLADIFMGGMACMNLVAILLLSKEVQCASTDYQLQRRKGWLPRFSRAVRVAKWPASVVAVWKGQQ